MAFPVTINCFAWVKLKAMKMLHYQITSGHMSVSQKYRGTHETHYLKLPWKWWILWETRGDPMLFSPWVSKLLCKSLVPSTFILYHAMVHSIPCFWARIQYTLQIIIWTLGFQVHQGPICQSCFPGTGVPPPSSLFLELLTRGDELHGILNNWILSQLKQI